MLATFIALTSSVTEHAVATAGAVTDTAADALAAIPPDPGKGTEPPKKVTDRLNTLLGWVAWVVFGICIGGVLIVAGRMAISHRRGEGGEHASGLAWVGAACILAGSAAAIVQALV
jgi:hypothetical protein